MDIEQEINEYFSLFGWGNSPNNKRRVASVLPKNWDNLSADIKKQYLEYANSPEFTLKTLKNIL